MSSQELSNNEKVIKQINLEQKKNQNKTQDKLSVLDLMLVTSMEWCVHFAASYPSPPNYHTIITLSLMMSLSYFSFCNFFLFF